MKKILSHILSFFFLIFLPIIKIWYDRTNKDDVVPMKTWMLDCLIGKFEEDIEIPHKDKFFFECLEKMEQDVVFKAMRWRIYYMFVKYYFLTMPKSIQREW